MYAARKLLVVGIVAATFSSVVMSTTPAAAWGRGWGRPGWGGGWGRPGWGGGWGRPGWGGGWGYGGWGGGWGGGGWGGGWGGGGWGYGGAALTGLALGAVAASAVQNQYGYAQPYYGYARPYRRARLCVANQALYDDWGDFIGYRRVRVAC